MPERETVSALTIFILCDYSVHSNASKRQESSCSTLGKEEWWHFHRILSLSSDSVCISPSYALVQVIDNLGSHRKLYNFRQFRKIFQKSKGFRPPRCSESFSVGAQLCALAALGSKGSFFGSSESQLRRIPKAAAGGGGGSDRRGTVGSPPSSGRRNFQSLSKGALLALTLCGNPAASSAKQPQTGLGTQKSFL